MQILVKRKRITITSGVRMKIHQPLKFQILQIEIGLPLEFQNLVMEIRSN